MKRTLYRQISFILAIFLSAAAAAGQPFCRTRTFNVSDGLPSNSISKVVQSPDGLIWIATWNGLSYFDGYGFASFRSGERHGELTSSRIVNITPDSEGKVWLLTYDRKPYVFDPVVSRFTPLDETITRRTRRACRLHEIYPAGEYMWMIDEGLAPSTRVRAALPVDTSSVEVYGRDKLRGGASRVLKVVLDSLGNEWVFTDAGVQLYGTSVACPGDFLEPAVVGDVTYFATTCGSFFSYRKGDAAFKPMPLPAGAGIRRVNALKPLDGGGIVAAVPGGVAVCDLSGSSWRMVGAGSQADNVVDVFVDSRRRVWAFTDAGAVWLTDPAVASARRVAVAPGQTDAPTSTIPLWVEDRFGTVWLAPKGGRFGFYDEETASVRPQAFLLPHLKYTAVPEIDRYFVDKQHNMWIGTTHDLTLVSFNNHTVKTAPLVINEEVRALMPCDGGKFLAGSRGGVLGRFSADGAPDGYLAKRENPDGSGRVFESEVPAKFSNHIYAMFQDADKDVWVGTKGDGLYLIRPDGSFSHFRASKADPYSIPTDTIYDIDQDEKGNIWIGSFGGGLLKAEKQPGGRVRFLHAGNELKNYPLAKFPRVRRVTHDGKGVVLLSTHRGLLTFSNEFKKPREIKFNPSVHVPGDPSSLQTADVLQALVTARGDIYVATMAGSLQKIESADLLRPQLKFSAGAEGRDNLFFLQNTMIGGNILSMIEDTGGNIYIVRETSILVYSPASNTVAVYGRNDMGGSVAFTEAAPAFSSESGKLLFGAMGGVVFLNPEEIAKSSHVPRIVFTGIQFQGEPEKKQMLNPGRIDVQGAKRNFAISFAALDYSDNSNIQYAYKLADDPDWTYIGTAHTAHFNHLGPGTHTLLVKSTDGNGVWLDNEREMAIEVHPDFWESNWAKLIYFGIFLVVGWLASYLFVLNRKSAMADQMRQKEKQFFINASHRLRTPLTLIGGPVAEVLETEPLSDRARGYLEKVHRNSQEMLSMVNGILTNASDHNYITDDKVPAVPYRPASTSAPSPSSAAPSPSSSSLNASTLPANVREAEAERASTLSSPAQSAPAGAPRVKILVVEDNDDLRSFLCDILSVQYDVISAPNGAVGLEKAEKEQPDFIITDVTMPEMDGLTMVQRIKQNKQLSHIPIIVLSARASVEDRVRGLSEGVDDYITKPFSATYLRQRISSIRTQRKILQQNFFEHIGQNFSAASQEPGLEPDPKSDPAPSSDSASSAAASEASEISGSSDNASSHSREWRLESPQIADADQEMMDKLLKFMEEHIADEDLKIEELAEAVNMGRTVFYGKIKALVGMSPSDFLRRMRMQRAEELIARSKMNFSQIAFRIGFSDPKYFTKCFKKETGMTPSEYRQQAARQQAADE